MGSRADSTAASSDGARRYFLRPSLPQYAELDLCAAQPEVTFGRLSHTITQTFNSKKISRRQCVSGHRRLNWGHGRSLPVPPALTSQCPATAV